MSTVAQDSPSPKKNPQWNDQVKLGRGHTDTGAFHRAIAVASELFESGAWDGRGLLIVHDAYETHLKMEFDRAVLVAGMDYEFASDSIYRRWDKAAEDLDLAQIVTVQRASENWSGRYVASLADGSEVEITPAQFEQWMRI